MSGKNRVFYSTEAPPTEYPAVGQRPAPASLPPHLYAPMGAHEIDIIQRVTYAEAFDTANFLALQCPRGGVMQILGYAIETNIADPLANVEFIPLVGRARVLPFHGTPQNNTTPQRFRIAIPPGTGLSDTDIRKTQLTIKPNETFSWRVVGEVAGTVGVRVVGYFLEGDVENISTQYGG